MQNLKLFSPSAFLQKTSSVSVLGGTNDFHTEPGKS